MIVAMTWLGAIQATIVHWKNMIAWAEARDPKRPADVGEMLDHLGENWTGNHCSLCTYATNLVGSFRAGCGFCLMHKYFEGCNHQAYPSLWARIDKAKTWRGWLHYARFMLRRLEKLETKYLTAAA